MPATHPAKPDSSASRVAASTHSRATRLAKLDKSAFPELAWTPAAIPPAPRDSIASKGSVPKTSAIPRATPALTAKRTEVRPAPANHRRAASPGAPMDRTTDSDGWTDAEDPDCQNGDEETGYGDTGCNDGLDNDEDGFIDDQDPACTSALADEVLGDGACSDACLWGDTSQGHTCALWDSTSMTWLDGLEDGDGHMHNRARHFTSWLRTRMMPEGGIFRGLFTDATFSEAAAYGGSRDSAIWTGTYLAAEAMRYMVTESPDAAAQMDATIRVLDRWWRISGDKGYLARYAAPANSPPVIDQLLDASDPENHRDVPFEGGTWHWRGNISRDQYQGVMLGFAAAYDATDDPDLKEIIRADVVDFIEVLMDQHPRAVEVTLNGIPMTVEMNLGHAVYTDDETPNGIPRLAVTTNPVEFEDSGFLIFWPNPSEYLRQIPGSRLAARLLPSKPGHPARIDVRGCAARHRRGAVLRCAPPSHRGALYASMADGWADIAVGWANTNDCGDSYHGLNIVFEPVYNWVRLEADPVRKARLQTAVLRDAMWTEVWDHKNVFFAYIYASQAHPDDDVTPTVTFHTDQLRLFPSPPYWAWPVDNTASYPPDSAVRRVYRPRQSTWTIGFPHRSCGRRTPGSSTTRVSRTSCTRVWTTSSPTGWRGYHGFLDDDSADTCLQWR